MTSHRSSNVEFSIHKLKYKEGLSKDSFKPELYKQDELVAQEARLRRDDSLQPREASTKSCGKLYFSLQYSDEVLDVGVLKASQLPAKDFSGTSDPYVRLVLLPDRRLKQQTRVHRRTLEPQFNENFLFRLRRSDVTSRALQLYVYDFDRFSRHDLIGSVLVKELSPLLDQSERSYYEEDILSVKQVSGAR